METKKGLSAIVATLLIILLTIVAVGIIWVVIRNVVQSGAEQVEIGAACASVDLSTSAAVCVGTGGGGNWTCNVTYYRGSGGEAIDGLRVTLSNGLTSFTQDVPGDVSVGATRTQPGINTGLLNTTAKPNSVQIAAYFDDASGTPQLCNPSGEFTDIG